MDTVADAGCMMFIVHARKAWLNGLSPKENREVPPLDYDRVHRLKTRRSELAIIINGGLESLPHAAPHLVHVDGVMLGRAVYADPYLLADVDRVLYGEAERPLKRLEVLDRYTDYAESELDRGARLTAMTRHILGLFHGQPRARAFRRYITENAHLPGAGIEVLRHARDIVSVAPADQQFAENRSAA